MSDKKAIWDVAQGVMQAFVPFYQEETARAMQDAPPHWFFLSLVRGNEPEPLPPARAQAMYPYNRPGQMTDALDAHVEQGLLEKVDDSYRLTASGRDTVERFFHTAHAALADVQPLPAGEMERLTTLLARLVEATLALPEPAAKYHLQYSRWTDPGRDGAFAARIDQYITDLARYRDDAHTASWQHLDVSGPAWEALTFAWRDRAHTADALAALTNRELDAGVYAEALEEISGRGWVKAANGEYHLTEAGKRVREAAEATTDRFFYAGWSALSEDELAELEDLLTRAHDNLNEAAQIAMWPLLTDVGQAIQPVTRAAVVPLFEKHFENPALFLHTRLAREIAPEPYSVDYVVQRSPYVSPARLEALLGEAMEAGFFTAGDGDTYVLTEKGKRAVDEPNEVFYARLAEIEALSEEQMETLVGLLQRVVNASLEADLPRKLNLEAAHNGPLPREYAPLALVDLALDDLRAFRDDSHIAAWQAHDVPGRAWEAFSFVWQGEHTTAEALAERLPYRGYTAGDYARSLERLAGRGWIEPTDDGYAVTDTGRALREGVEEQTNAYFYGPWRVLDAQEQAQLRTLLIQLKLRLEALAEEETEQ